MDKDFTSRIAFVIIKIHINSAVERKVKHMPTNAEVIEILARKLERARILNDLKECKTLEEYQALVRKYEALCNDDKM